MSKSAKCASRKQDDGDLAELLRQIVREYGIAESPMPVYSPGPLLMAYHLALALDPSTVQTAKRIPGGWESAIRPVAPPNDEAAKRAHNLKAVAWILSDIMQRWKTTQRCSLQSHEKDKLLQIADVLDGAKAKDSAAAESQALASERTVSVRSGVLGFVLAAIVIGALEAYIHLASGQFSQWILGHNRSLGLQLSFGVVILLGFMGLFLRNYRKWIWGTGVLAIVAVILQII